MDRKLISWAYAVKARQRRKLRPAGPAPVPPLWVFSDAVRLPDPAAALLRVPKGLAGLVLRTAATMDAVCLQRTLAVCRARRVPVVMVQAGPRAGLRQAGRHFPGAAAIRRCGFGWVTAAAHGRAELSRIKRGQVGCVFLSPAFTTRSHPGASALGPLRWCRLAAHARVPVVALGGLTGDNIRLLRSRALVGAGFIGAAAD